MPSMSASGRQKSDVPSALARSEEWLGPTSMAGFEVTWSRIQSIASQNRTEVRMQSCLMPEGDLNLAKAFHHHRRVHMLWYFGVDLRLGGAEYWIRPKNALFTPKCLPYGRAIGKSKVDLMSRRATFKGNTILGAVKRVDSGKVWCQ